MEIETPIQSNQIQQVTQNEENHPTFLTTDDEEFIQQLTQSEQKYLQEMQTQQSMIETMTEGYDQKHNNTFPQQEYRPRYTIVRKTEDQLRQEIQNELEAKIAIERQRQLILQKEIDDLKQRKTEYDIAKEQYINKIINEQNEEKINVALMDEFGIEINIEKLPNEGNVVLVKVTFEKIRKYNRGVLELKIENGIISIHKCDPEVREIERLLDHFYHHHNFMVFLLNVRNCFKI